MATDRINPNIMFRQNGGASPFSPIDTGNGPQLLNIDSLEIPDELPILPIENMVVFPFMIAPLIISDDYSKKIVEEALVSHRMIGAVTHKEGRQKEVAGFDDLYEVGTVSMILKMLRIPDGSLRVLIHGMKRMRIVEPITQMPYLKAKIEILNGIESLDNETQAMMRNVNSLLNRIIKASAMPEDLSIAAININDPGKLADLIASNISLSIIEQQEILEAIDIKERLRKVLFILNKEIDMLDLGSKIQSQVRTKIDKHQRNFMLKEQLKAIKEELGEEDPTQIEIEELKSAITKAKMPKYAKAVATKELKRLESMSTSSAEYTVSRTYLDWIVSLPWAKHTKDNLDIAKAAQILDEDHYGLEKIKERILEYLSVLKLKNDMKGPILCFVGPPGVGKTSLGKSIARALGRKFYRASLGGMRDEAEIRGHRRTYIGALPGMIIKALKTCESNNPLIMLDEVDKLGNDFHGDPASALLEVLDPEQNNSFADRYLDIPFDLTKVMFITTANMLDTIPQPLLDRMEVIRLSGYTLEEKVNIAKKYLIPRQIERNGITKEKIEFNEEAIVKIIADYTKEAGLRNLERTIGTICRKNARQTAEGNTDKVIITPELVRKLLGAEIYYSEAAQRSNKSGVSTGLAWTQAGGEIMFIEAVATPGSGNLILTGQLGDVMKESAQAAKSFLHSISEDLQIDPEFFTKKNIHIHFPAGAIPKDGPSGGIAICSALASLVLDKPLKPLTAMTGEITIKGNVLPIGGVKEKVLAAVRAGIKTVLLPEKNKKDMEDIPEELRNTIKFKFFENMTDVLEYVLSIKVNSHKTPTKKDADLSDS